MTSAPSSARVVNDLSSWSFATLTVPLNEKFFLFEQINPRINDNISNFDVLFVRTALGYHLTPRLSLWAGYDWFTNYNFNEVKHEHRPWQQIQYNRNFRWLETINRLRIEERIFTDADTVTRLRYMLRLAKPLDQEKKWRFILQDEIFFNLHSGSQREGGFDENRLFVGINRTFNEHVNLDFGYQFQHVNIEQTDLLNHSILANLFINL